MVGGPTATSQIDALAGLRLLFSGTPLVSLRLVVGKVTLCSLRLGPKLCLAKEALVSSGGLERRPRVKQILRKFVSHNFLVPKGPPSPPGVPPLPFAKKGHGIRRSVARGQPKLYVTLRPALL